MADEKATLLIVLKDKASKGINKVGRALEFLKRNSIAVGAAIAAVSAFLIKSIQNYATQEAAVVKLNKALEIQGKLTESTSKDLQNFASELQGVTTFGDETILNMQSLLVSFGLVGDELKNSTKAVLDLSVGLGIDLKAAALLVGKAFAGDIATLSRYGIKIQEGLKESEKFDAVLEQLTNRFGGAAQAQALTFQGRLTQLKNSFGDLQEKIGEETIPVLEVWVGWLDTLVEKADRLISKEIQSLRGRELTIRALREQIDVEAARAASLDRFGQLTDEDTQKQLARLETLEKALAREQGLLKQEQALEEERRKPPPDIKVEEDKELIALQERADQRIAMALFTTEEIRLIEEQALIANLQAHGDWLKARQLQEALDVKKRREIAKAGFEAAKGIFAELTKLSGSSSKELNAIAKAGAIGRATMSAFEGANKALAQGGIFGFAMAAAVIATGLANVAKISATPLQAGGVVLPETGGTIANIAEAGRPEAVIPLEDEEAKEKLQEALEPAPSIVIQAGVIVADQLSVRTFAEMIDEELFNLRSSRQTVT